MTTITELYRERCTKTTDDRYIPKYWNPPVVERRPYTLRGDALRPCHPNWGVHEVVQRILALGLELELPVGQFVSEHLQGVEAQSLKLLLKSNIADEARHHRGIELAVEAYPLTDEAKGGAKLMASFWQDRTDSPILLAAALEIGVFLSSLAALRLFGGSSLALMADGISRDEYRHASVNRMLVTMAELDLMDVWDLVNETITWVFAGLNIPASELGVTIDADLFRRSASELMVNGEAKELDDLVNYANHLLPFEISNDRLY